MKKLFFLFAFFMAFMLPAFFGCTKEKTEVIDNIEIITNPIVKDTPFVKQNPDTCVTVTSKGRIIGVDYCFNFMSEKKVMGTGFIIEIDNETSRDTALTYEIPDSLFQFLPSDRFTGMLSYLFTQEAQNKYKIKFNYTFTSKNAFHNYQCNITADRQLPPLFSIRRKEILMTCISSQ